MFSGTQRTIYLIDEGGLEIKALSRANVLFVFLFVYLFSILLIGSTSF